MASTGYQFAGAGANVDTGSQAWQNPGNVVADDGSVARVPEEGEQTSDSLFASTFGFAVPDGATIDGVQVRVRRLKDAGGIEVAQSAINLVNDSTGLGGPKVQIGAWDDAEEAYVAGDVDDVWGATLTPAIVNASTFGVRIAVTWGSGLPNPTLFARVDSVEINVHYTEAAAGRSGDLTTTHAA